MALYAEVIGDPVAHSKSPLIHKFWLGKLGLNHDFRLTRVRQNELVAFIEQRRRDPNWCGCSVTLPHKQAVAEYLDALEPDAAAIGAVNCIARKGDGDKRLIGINTDWRGFLEPLQPWLGADASTNSAMVVGTGGAAAAVYHALVRSGFEIFSMARDPEKAINLRRRFQIPDEDIRSLSEYSQASSQGVTDCPDSVDLLVNATPLGMTGFHPLQVNLDNFPSNLIVYDLVYQPLETELLRSARAKGMPVIDGISMLIGQAASAFRHFFEEPAPRQHDEELRRLLTS